MKWIFCIIIFFLHCCIFAQEIYNNCDNALELCPNEVVSVNNIGANKTLCNGCEDDFNFCYLPTNTIWLKFTTNSTGGDVIVTISNVVFENLPGQGTLFNSALIRATIPCNSTSYSLAGTCSSDASGNTQLTGTSLAANTQYYIVISGSQNTMGSSIPAELTANVSISGTAVNREIPRMGIGAPGFICVNDLTAIYAERENCRDSSAFRWYVNGNLAAITSSTDSTFYTTALQNGDIIKVEGTCFNICPLTISDEATIVAQSLTINAGPDQTIEAGETAVIDVSGVPNTLPLWSPSYGISDSSQWSIVVHPFETTTYTLKITDTLTNCTAYDYITIFVHDGLKIPNTFSPNGDGENDIWEIKGIDKYPDCHVSIFNRWGQIVFTATGYNLEKAFTGEGKTGKLNEGVYFYAIELRDADSHIIKGSLTLIR